LEKTLLVILRAPFFYSSELSAVLAAEPESPIEVYFSPGVCCGRDKSP